MSIILQPGNSKSAHDPKDLTLLPDTERALTQLQEAGWPLFLVSNQPSYAKGKTSWEKLKAIEEKFARLMNEAGIGFREYYYCYCHPDSVVEGLGEPCQCRKPRPYFLHLARDTHNVNLMQSWMVGDRESDIECGKAAGARTIQVTGDAGANALKTSGANYRADSLLKAVELVLGNTKPSPE